MRPPLLATCDAAAYVSFQTVAVQTECPSVDRVDVGVQTDAEAVVKANLPDKGGVIIPLGVTHECISSCESVPTFCTRAVHVLSRYFSKMSGGKELALKGLPPSELFFSGIGAFLGILLISGINHYMKEEADFQLLVGSFGASAVLVYGVPESKLAQPRNLIGGQVLSALVGWLVRLALGHVIWLSSAVGMALALLVMHVTGTTHPPGGATALIAASSATLYPWHGFQYVVAVFFGCSLLLLVGLFTNNLSPRRVYPTFWFGFHEQQWLHKVKALGRSESNASKVSTVNP